MASKIKNNKKKISSKSISKNISNSKQKLSTKEPIKPLKVIKTPGKMIKSEYFEFKGFLSFLILHELSTNNLTGEDLAKRIGARKQTMLTPGTIYPALKYLRKCKLVVYKKFGRKKVYSLTSLGEAELKKLYVLFKLYFYDMKKYM